MTVNMKILSKNTLIVGVFTASALTFGGCSSASSAHPFGKTNHFAAKKHPAVNHKSVNSPYRHPFNGTRMHRPKVKKIGPRKPPAQYKSLADRLRGRKMPRFQRPALPPHPLDMFQRWVDYEPAYRFYPGDQIEVIVTTAPELSRTLTIGPDGRVSMPASESVMAAGRTLSQVKDALQMQLATQLRDPTIAVTSRAFAPQQIFVGGEVGQQGTFTLPGPIGSLEAIFMAGGFLPSAKTKEVAILRRAPNGGLMLRVINHNQGLNNIRSYADNMQLRRGDIIFVPRNDVAEISRFVRGFRDIMPIDFSLSYNLGNGFNGN